MTTSLSHAVSFAEKHGEALSIPRIREMLGDDDAQIRLKALYSIRVQLAHCWESNEYFHLARGLIEDADYHCRWQSLIVIGEFIDSHTAEVWEIIRHYGQSDDDDMRVAIACVLAEHSLERDDYKDKYGEQIKELRKKSPKFAKMFDMCWF